VVRCLVGPSFVDRPFPNVGLGFQNPAREMGKSPYFTFACDEGGGGSNLGRSANL
jgi:hypothetical protein